MARRVLTFILVAVLGVAAAVESEKETRLQQQKLEKRQKEACLTLTRSFYHSEESTIK
jgi:hypothetical protein